MPGLVLDIFTHSEVVILTTLTSFSLEINVQEGAFDEESNHH